jgi:hypothetical protein
MEISKKISDKSLQNIKYIMMEIFSKCGLFDYNDCITVFKSKTGEIMRYLKNFPQYNKFYINLNKLIVKLPEILLKLFNLETESADEIITSLIHNNQYFDISLSEEDEDYKNDSSYFNLVAIHYQALREFLSYLNDIQDLLFNIKQLAPIIKKSKLSLVNSTSSGSNSGLNDTIQFSEDKLKHIYDKLDYLIQSNLNFQSFYSSKEETEDTELLYLSSSVHELVLTINYLFQAYKSILCLDTFSTTGYMIKVMKYLETTKKSFVSKLRIYNFLLTFYVDNVNKQSILFLLFFNNKKDELIKEL